MVKSKLWQQMKDASVQLAVTLPLDNLIRKVLTSRFDLRNHRKITVIGGEITHCGARNSVDPEFRVKPKYAPWVDFMLRFTGSVVAQNQLLFASDWMRATGEPLSMIPLHARTRQDGSPAQVMGDDPTERKGATPQLFATTIGCGQESLTISKPYFIPDATVLDALCVAASRSPDLPETQRQLDHRRCKPQLLRQPL